MLRTLMSLTLFLAVTTQAQSDDSESLVAQLLTASTQTERISDIKANSAFVFDFLKNPQGNGQGGFIVGPTNPANFPALLNGNGAMAVGFMGPCGLNVPHSHPRASELQIIVQGGPVRAAFIMEDGARIVNNTIPIGSATIYPKGSIHYQQNLVCEPTIFVAGFDNVDPGTSHIAPNFFAFDQGVIDATLGEIGVSVLDHLTIPPNIVLGIQECLDRCGIDRSTFNFSATFKDYAIFSNSPQNCTPSSTTVSYAATLLKKRSVAGVPFAQNPLRSVIIGLAAATAALFFTTIGLLAISCRCGSSIKTPPQISGRDVSLYGTSVTAYDNSETLLSRPSMEKSLL